MAENTKDPSPLQKALGKEIRNQAHDLLKNTQDKLDAASTAYYTALLTFNGILLAFLASRIEPASSTLPFLSAVILGAAAVSVALLLYVFHTLRADALSLAKTMNTTVEEAAEGRVARPEITAAFEVAENHRRRRKGAIYTVEGLALLELLCIFILLLKSAGLG